MDYVAPSDAASDPILKRDQISWVRVYTGDYIGPVFVHDGRYFRAVRPEAADHAAMLFETGIIDHLHRTGFLNRQSRSDLKVEGSPFTIDSEPAPFDVMANAFTFRLLQRAALKWLDASLYLYDKGLCLMDGHYGNFSVYGNCEPRWFDLGSIVPLPPRTNLKRGLAAFTRFFFGPLLAASKHPALREVIRNHALVLHAGFSDVQFEYFTGFQVHKLGSERPDILHAMRDAIAAIEFQWIETNWSRYSTQRIDRVSAEGLRTADPTTREGCVLATLAQELRPDDIVLDLGGNDGFFGLHAAAAGAKAILSDSDEGALERGLSRVDNEPTWTAAFVAGDAMNNAYEADIVLALALTHHLRLGQNRYFDMIAEKLSERTRRVLIIEFMPWGLSVKGPPPSLPRDYTLENFIEQFRAFFDSVEVVAHNVAEAGHPRVLVLCRK